MESGDTNLVEIWLRRDPIRWLAGAMAGLFAGIVMIGFAMVLCVVLGTEVWFPIKLAALPILGSSATEYGMHVPAILVGLVTLEALAAFLGVIYAHFTGTNSLPALLAMGFVWGTFSWIFINNLFMQSFTTISALRIAPGVVFPIVVVFGLSLTSVVFFDRALRGNRT